MTDWLNAGSPLVHWLAALSPVLFVGTLLVIPVIVVRMRSDYFLDRDDRLRPRARRSAARLVLRVAKNVLGLVLLVAGVAMLVLPGQGILTLLLAVTCLDFPGKRRVELFFVRRRPVFRAINTMRKRGGRPPLELPAESSGVIAP